MSSLTRPTVTIVTPSYNQGDFIRATIESVLAQDYPELEYIVMDGGSTDHTSAIAAEYRGRLTWVSEKDRGQAHAINKGFQRARGEIVAWLNSDDLLLPGAVQRAVDGFASAPRTGAVYGEGYLMDRDGRITGRFPATEPFNLWKLTYLSDYVLQQSAFFRRAAVEEIGWLDENLHYAMDWDLFIRLGKRFGLHYIPEYLGILREYAEAKTFSGGAARIEEIRRVLARHTGCRYAPGYWLYYFDTHQRVVRSWLESHAPAALRLPAKLAGYVVYVYSGGLCYLVLRSSQHLFRDRCVGPRLRWMLPEGSGDVVVRGHVPEHRNLARQRLTIYMPGGKAGPLNVGPGPFVLRFPAASRTRGPLQLEVRASRSRWVRACEKIGFRRIAWVLDTIEWGADGPPGESPL
jgi:glycosyltransferase involved in cell wall biosynthesis